MDLGMLGFLNRVIEYSFYALVLLVPLVFTSNTSELFEFNKMWLTFGLTVVIGASWFTKMIVQKKILFARTPLDIPIGLFLASQIISTLFSWDSHVSLWGYYSRFNGGLLSIFSYIFLYYAFVSNASLFIIKRLLYVSLASGLIVALWGLPSHFGYDPTCLLFRGTFDVSCWTADFQPKIRIFSTLGQPNWMAAYLAILIPITVAFGLKSLQAKGEIEKKNYVSSITYYVFDKSLILTTLYLLLIILFYIDIIFTASRSGFLGLTVGMVTFALMLFWYKRRGFEPMLWHKRLAVFAGILATLTLVATLLWDTTIIPQLRTQFANILSAPSQPTSKQAQRTSSPTTLTGPALEVGSTESGEIRKHVWQGAIDIWKAYPLFGTGVETYAFAYYKFRPIGHNATSEWDFLYNKAHNEYLNYLATTGTAGLGSYLLMIGWFLWLSFKRIKTGKATLLEIGLVSAYITILVSNFFGFSVVIVNLYLFMIPALVFILAGIVTPKNNVLSIKYKVSSIQWVVIVGIILTTVYLLHSLWRFWNADKAYYLGYNFDRIQQYQTALPYLQQAVSLRPSEPVFRDEYATNLAVLAVMLASESQATQAAQLARQAINENNALVQQYSNNLLFWKSRVRIYNALSQVDQAQFSPLALEAIKKARELATHDVKLAYSMGVLQGQNGDLEGGIKTLETAKSLKPDYADNYFALGLFYRELATNGGKSVVNAQYQQKAVENMRYILDNIASDDARVLQALETWGEL